MPPLDPYVLKANGVAFSGLQVQLAEGELTAAKSSYNFNMDAEGFTLDNGVTNMSWDHVRIAAGHATDFQAIIPAVAGNPQATTLQINDKIAFNMSGSYAYMNKDEVHIFDNNASHTATYGTSLVLENVSDNLVLDIGTDGISFTPGYTKISWPDILSAGLPFADSWLFAVNDNASYNTSTLVLNNTLNINDGTADNTINITALSQPSINLANVGTSTTALSSVLNNTNLTITDANTDGAYNNGTSILDSVSLSLSHAPSYDYSNDITLSTVDANLYIQTTAVEGVNNINVHASDGFASSFASTDTFNQKTITFSKTTLSSNSTYNDGTDPLTALTDSFEITSVNSNMAFNLIESNPISNDSSALNSYQQVSKNNDGVYKSTLDLTAFNDSTSVTNAITVTAVDTANSIANPTINLKVTDSTTTVLESTLANNLLTLTNKDTSLAYVAESLVINSSTYKSEYKPSETETNSVEISSVTTSIHLTETGTETNKATSELSRTILEIKDYNTTTTLNNSKSAITSNAISTEESADGVNTYSVTISSTDASVICSTPLDGTTDTVTISPSQGFVKSFISADTFSESGAILSSAEVRSYDNFNDGTASTAFNRSFEVVTLGQDDANVLMMMLNPVNGDSSRFRSGQQTSLNGDGVYKSVAALETFNSATNVSNSITFTAIDTANSISAPVINLNVTGTSTSKPTGSFSNTEMSITDTNTDGEYNNAKTTVLSKNISIVSSTDGVNAKSISLNASGTAEIGISEVETNADYKILTVNTLGFNVNQNLTSLNTTKYVAVTPSAISSTTTFDDATINSVVKYLAYGNNTSTNFFSLVESNPFTEDQSVFSASQRVSVGGDGGYKSNLLVSNYNASTNTTKSISLTAIDTDGSITDPVIKVNDGTIVSSLKSESLSSTGHLSLSVPTGKELTLAVPSGADLVIGDGAVSNVADGGLTNLWMRIKIGSSYYKIPLMADMAILDNLSIINANIADRLSKNVNALSVTDTYTLLLGKSVISYTGDREYWGPPQDTVSTYVSMNNTSYLKLTNFDYVGWDFNSINFTNAGSLDGKIFISLWTDISMTIRFSVVNTTIQSGGVSTEYKTTINTNNGSWTYVQVNLADFVFDKGDGSAVKATVFSNIRQFLFATDLNISNPVYIQYVALKRTA